MGSLKTLLLTSVLCVCGLAANAQVKNMALQLEPQAFVECGKLPALDNLESYTIQLWYSGNATSADVPGTLLRRGTTASEMLLVAVDHQGVAVTVGNASLSASVSSTKDEEWHQITLLCDKGDAALLIDGAVISTGKLPAIPIAPNECLYLGSGSFAGRLDDVRIWDDVLIPDYDYYINTTLNEYNPQADNLLVYYKLDQADCPDVVNYKSIWAKEEFSPNHGLMSATGASKVRVEDNDKLPYLINSAYTANERFWDRVVSPGQYKVSNDIIILGVQSYSDGHLKCVTPNCHAQIIDAEYLKEFNGRTGVISLDGKGKIVTNSDAFSSTVANGYTFETYLYIEKWVEGATIMRKETDDHTKGIAIYLGSEESQSVVVRIDGKEFTRKLGSSQKLGNWFHFAVMPNTIAAQPKDALNFVLNGNGLSATTYPDEIIMMPSDAENCDVVIGENFIGKIDETAFWQKTHSAQEIKDHKDRGLPMPKVGSAITADPMFFALAYYKYDWVENPGWDYYSQDNWLKIIKDVYEGYTGYNIRISVKSHSGWQNTIESATRRKNFAKDLAAISEPYDGVELDLEWAETNYQMSQLAELCKTIREYLPEGKLFFLSCHCYASTYKVPKDFMQYIDGFTFQVYGPQNSWFKWDTFVNCAKTFINWGFPKDKIMLAYSTTTSGGYKNGSLSTHIIKGVKDGFMPDGYTPNENEEYATFGDMSYWFTGTRQVYKRAKYCVDNNLQGIFYWDMGNDMPFDSGKNLARISSYAMCGNVDPYVTEVNRDNSGIVDPIIKLEANSAVVALEKGQIRASFLSGEPVKSIAIYTIDGRQVECINGGKSVVCLLASPYIVKVNGANGSVASIKALMK